MNSICPAECEPIDLEAAMNFRQRGFIVEEKLDGVRAVVHVGQHVRITGRRWVSSGILAELKQASGIAGLNYHPILYGCVLDGELMRDGTYHVFDLPVYQGEDMRAAKLVERKRWLASLSEFMPQTFRLVRSFASVGEMGGFGEGLIWKDESSKYGFGWFKAKRVETLDVIVTRLLDEGVAETEGHGKVVGVPACIKPGDCIEVEAFKVFDRGTLRNGRFVRTRDDK